MQIGVLFLRVLGLRGWVGGKKKRRREEEKRRKLKSTMTRPYPPPHFLNSISISYLPATV